MSVGELDNPVWHSLSGPHRNLAGASGELRWYPRTVAPFVAIAAAGTTATLNAATDPEVSDPAYFLGVAPRTPPRGWEFVAESVVLQMVPHADTLRDDPRRGARDVHSSAIECRELTAGDRAPMLELARLAFPDYFRERTADLGVYLGIFDGADLVAMAGERMALPGWQEISGVCTHPEFLGRGYARELTRALLRRHRQREISSFLHVSEHNARARRLYESMGFTVRAGLPLLKIAQVI